MGGSGWKFEPRPSPPYPHLCRLTVLQILRLLTLLINHDDDDQDDDLGQDPEERPQGGQVAADPQHRLLLAAAVHVGGVALVLARIQTDVQVGDVELGVVVFAADGEPSARVVDFLKRNDALNLKLRVPAPPAPSCLTYPEDAVVEAAPAPGRVRVAHGLTVEAGLLPFVPVLAALVACDLRSS